MCLWPGLAHGGQDALCLAELAAGGGQDGGVGCGGRGGMAKDDAGMGLPCWSIGEEDLKTQHVPCVRL